MAKHKKVAKQPEANPEPIEAPTLPPLTEEIREEVLNNPVLTPGYRPVIEEPVKPLFVSDKEESYRQLLLEHPNRPYITNIQEATHYFEELDKWQRKVKSALQ